jgi:hypothetical protein
MPRDLDRASAQALIELAMGSAPVRRQRPVVLSNGELSTGGVVGAEAERRLACDASLNGKPIPTSTRRVVEARDGYRCTFPGCSRELHLQCHHIVHRIDGGSNAAPNLQLVCWQHHKLIHEGGWAVRGPGGPSATWIRPDGTVFEPRSSFDTS